MSTASVIMIHGINTTNPWFYRPWVKCIPEIKQYNLNVIPVKWSSWSWEKDLFRIFIDKVYRDNQINKVIKAINSTKDPIFLLSHSWGTVWVYKAIHRMAKDNTIKDKRIWVVMCGSPLGGTELPFGKPYIDIISKVYSNEKTPQEIEKLYNLWNKDDYVSGTCFMDRMENRNVIVDGFSPGLNEHRIEYYLKDPIFKEIIGSFTKKYCSIQETSNPTTLVS